MINIHKLTFNAFQENTYLIWTKSLDCMIIDPGCSDDRENKILSDFINSHDLRPVRLLNTHCHIDHILGNQYVADQYHLELEAHRAEVTILQSGEMVSKMYGIPFRGSPKIAKYLEEGQSFDLEGNTFQVILAPGHSPGSLCFYHAESSVLIGGDVLFHGSIGRTDLPGGNHGLLIQSITKKLMILPDETRVLPGHGPETTIGFERKSNPFLTS